ncbi:nuclear transport factor 2 family protein [Streptacidiphilus sp. PB12-B1b]|uniref:nuclear transport factor 2 family protein n=1 Tax=Streptacidiphilus sp. PB12-B1b TaxID=2705012 RepID=UPI0015F89DAC|nr:nuclear transport factor 2 family protein [Streptacidiphilus sp. PB12-B1b]QMU76741.1 nuclear transport factor 2 family protein [Streptacidiphilus sp. PB12-B1b]
MNAQQLFDAWVQAVLVKDTDAMADLYCEDGEHHFSFRDGAPFIKGREAIRAHLAATFGASPFTFQRLSACTVHRTTDPDTIIVECTFEGAAPGGAPFNPSYVEVLTARDGRIARVRDYENLAYRAGRQTPAADAAPAAPSA